MKRRILAIFLLIAILFNNYIVFADGVQWPTNYKREGGSNLSGIAKNINDNPLNSGSYARSNFQTAYVTTGGLNLTCEYSLVNASEKLFADITLPNETNWEKVGGIGSVLYTNALEFNGKMYNVNLTINRITRVSDSISGGNIHVRILLGNMRDPSKTEGLSIADSTYGSSIFPDIRTINLQSADKDKIAIEATYTVIDKDTGAATPITGLFGVTDIDNNQGYYIHGFTANENNSNIYVANEFTTHSYKDTVKYKKFNGGTYIYTSHEGAIGSPVNPDIPATSLPQLDAYALMNQVSSVTTTFTFENISAASGFVFRLPKQIQNVFTITTQAVNGTITPTVTNIQRGASSTITYSPNTGYKIKSITKDGANEPITTSNTTSLTFSDIDDNHSIKVEFEPIIYNINYVLNGGTNSTENPGTYTVKDTVTFKNPTRQGYTFQGWYTDSALSNRIVEIPVGSTGDKTVYAKWAEATNTAYKEEHYKQNKSGQYVLAATESKTGTTNASVTAVAKTFPGYKLNEANQNTIKTGTIKADGSLVLRLYYDLENYRINYVLNGGTNSTENPGTYTVEDNITFKPATRPGYDFKGWYEDPNFTNQLNGTAGKTGDITVYAKWEARKDTPFKVEHYKQNKAGEYTLADTENLTGTTDTEATATPKVYKGYIENTEHVDRVAKGTVTADGKLVLKLYYDIVKYKIDYVLYGGENSPLNPSVYTVEDNIDFEPATKPGYDFTGWYEDEKLENKIDSITNRAEDITVYAGWKARTDTVYRVEHYKEVEGGKYELALTEEKAGETDTEVTAEALTFKGYIENTSHNERIATAIIKGDGSTILRLYYDREKYTVSFYPQNGETIDDQIVPYLEKANEPIEPKKEGYEFQNWYYIDEEGREVIYNFDDPVTHDIVLIAKWKEIKQPGDATDDSTSQKIIPKTGEMSVQKLIIISIIGMIVVIFGIKLFKLRDISK